MPLYLNPKKHHCHSHSRKLKATVPVSLPCASASNPNNTTGQFSFGQFTSNTSSITYSNTTHAIPNNLLLGPCFTIAAGTYTITFNFTTVNNVQPGGDKFIGLFVGPLSGASGNSYADMNMGVTTAVTVSNIVITNPKIVYIITTDPQQQLTGSVTIIKTG